jgi:predicted tellurium resistance membrane protein TerC
MDLIFHPDNWIAFLTLCALEIVLGIDNIIFISILTGKLPVAQQKKARQVGLTLAMFMRLGLLFSINWIMQLTQPLFNVFDHDFSGRDLILIFGGLFLIYKSVKEIHTKLEAAEEPDRTVAKATYSSIIIQIILLDLVFSLDSVITAVGMIEHIEIMVAAIIVSVGVMMVAAKPISDFVQQHPALKVLALAFLIMIGVALWAEGLSFHIPKGYIYASMAFAIGVEMINIRLNTRKRAS